MGPDAGPGAHPPNPRGDPAGHRQDAMNRARAQRGRLCLPRRGDGGLQLG